MKIGISTLGISSRRRGKPELLPNGDFATDTLWAKGVGWTISGGKGNCDGTQTGSTGLTQNGIVTPGITYTIVFTVSNLTAGQIRVLVGNSAATPWATANGTYTHDVTAVGSDQIIIQGDLNFTGSVDDVSVKAA